MLKYNFHTFSSAAAAGHGSASMIPRTQDEKWFWWKKNERREAFGEVNKIESPHCYFYTSKGKEKESLMKISHVWLEIYCRNFWYVIWRNPKIVRASYVACIYCTTTQKKPSSLASMNIFKSPTTLLSSACWNIKLPLTHTHPQHQPYVIAKRVEWKKGRIGSRIRH